MTAPIPPAAPLNWTIRPGLPAAFELRFYSPSDPDDASSDPEPIDLTDYAPANLAIKLVASDTVSPAWDAAIDLAMTATLPTQTGANLGVVRYTATGVVTAAINAEGWTRGEFDVVIADPDGFPAVWQSGLVIVTAPTSTDETAPSATAYQRFNVILRAGPSGTVTPDGVPWVMTTLNTTTFITAVATNTIPSLLTIRVTAVSGFVSPATILIRKAGGANYMAPVTLTGLDTVGEVRSFPLSGVIPALQVGESMEGVVQTAASAGTMTVEVEVRT